MNKNKSKNSSEKKTEDLVRIDEELKNLIDENESFQKGISKLFSEIKKEISNSNNLNK